MNRKTIVIRHSLLLLLLFTLLQAMILHETIPCPEEMPLQKVGMTSRQFVDSNRINWNGSGHKITRGILWYPADDADSKKERTLGPDPEFVVIERGILKKGKYPLVLLSHGAGGSPMSLAAWGHYLATRGYIVAAIDHRDTTGQSSLGSLSLSDQQMWRRPGDVSALLDHLLSDPEFGPAIDTSRIAAAGFSLGGYTVIAVGGARLSLGNLQAQSRIEDLPEPIRTSVQRYTALLGKDSLLQASVKHSGDSYKDGRVKGIFALSPAIGQGFTKAGLSDIDVPVEIVVGETDFIAPKETNAQLYANGIKNARLTILPGEAGHITQPGPQSEENWRKVYALSWRFFERLLKEK
jgi:predicted dienelactone hydrolase